MKYIYRRLARISALFNAHKINGRVDLEDADRLYRWLTKYYEKE